MSGTALYRALIDAGAKEDIAKEAAGEIDDMNARLIRVEVMLKIIIAISIANFLLLAKMAFSQ